MNKRERRYMARWFVCFDTIAPPAFSLRITATARQYVAYYVYVRHVWNHLRDVLLDIISPHEDSNLPDDLDELEQRVVEGLERWGFRHIPTELNRWRNHVDE